ncbi:MAG: hypothetical protein K0U52_01405 [Gammaproteobacteria bacterium]|nr:hypothetical protein [Gammaproteobacteria bacterium]
MAAPADGPGFNLSGLTQYVDETSFELISKAVLGTNLASYVDVRAGLKGNSVAIPLLEDTFNVQNGNSCGWDANNTASISQVDMCIYHPKVQHEFCPQALRDTFMAKSLAAGQFGSSENLPQEAVFANYFVEKLQNYNEKYIISGDSTTSCEGIQAPFAASAVSASAFDINWVAATGTGNAVDGAQALYEALPGEVSMADDLVLIVSVGDYKTLALAVTQGNYYHIAPDMTNLFIPGTNVRVVASAGIAEQNGVGVVGKNTRILTRASNIILGTDLTGDFEQFKLWYSEDNDQVRATMKWAIGMAVIQPELGVIANKTRTN